MFPNRTIAVLVGGINVGKTDYATWLARSPEWAHINHLQVLSQVTPTLTLDQIHLHQDLYTAVERLLTVRRLQQGLNVVVDQFHHKRVSRLALLQIKNAMTCRVHAVIFPQPAMTSRHCSDPALADRILAEYEPVDLNLEPFDGVVHVTHEDLIRIREGRAPEHATMYGERQLSAVAGCFDPTG